VTMPGLVVRKDNGELKWYRFFNRGSQYTFYPSKEHGQPETGKKVGQGFNLVKYLPGYWMSDVSQREKKRIGGGNSLIALEKDGALKYFPFVGESFMVHDSGRTVGKGFSADWDYVVAEWTGSGKSDLLVRDDQGRLRLFVWNGREFTDLGGQEKVGDGFDKSRFTHFLPGYWTGRSVPDLVVREKDGDLFLYPFDGKSFKDQGKPRKIGAGFDNDFTHYWVDEWMGHGLPDLVVRHKNGNLIRYPYGRKRKDGELVFDDPPYLTVGKGFKDKWTYCVGHWRNPGRPDLIVCDDDHRMRFYPFDGNTFMELPEDQKIVGRDWEFTHFWDFYT